jgi:hypothetical protein
MNAAKARQQDHRGWNAHEKVVFLFETLYPGHQMQKSSTMRDAEVSIANCANSIKEKSTRWLLRRASGRFLFLKFPKGMLTPNSPVRGLIGEAR